MARNATGWYTNDLMENSNRDDFETEIRVLPSKPSIYLSSLGAYFAWTNKFQLASQSRLQFLYLDTQFPDQYVRDKTLAVQAHQNVDHHGTHVEFRQPQILPIGESAVLLAYGTEVQGGPRVAYLENRFSNVWELYNLDGTRDFRGVDSMSMTKDAEGTIFVTWSMNDQYAEKTYEFDAYVGTVNEEEAGSLDNWDFSRLTLSDNIDHLFPNISLISTGTEVTYIETLFNETLGETTTDLVFSTEVPQEIPVTNPTLGFFIGLVFVIGVVFLYRVLIMNVLRQEKEEEILPHMINLKDSIERD